MYVELLEIIWYSGWCISLRERIYSCFWHSGGSKKTTLISSKMQLIQIDTKVTILLSITADNNISKPWSFYHQRKYNSSILTFRTQTLKTVLITHIQLDGFHFNSAWRKQNVRVYSQNLKRGFQINIFYSNCNHSTCNVQKQFILAIWNTPLIYNNMKPYNIIW